MLTGRVFNLVLRPTVQYAPRLPFSILTAHHEKPLPPRTVINENDITESFLKGTGPGGQKINKTSSAVQLKHLPTGIVVKCQGTRSREQNRRTARRLLGERIEELEKGDQARTVIKAERASRKKASADKKKKRKYRRLEEEKASVGGGEQGSGEVEDETGADDALNQRDVLEELSSDKVKGQRRPP